MKIKQTVFPALLLLGGGLVATPARAHGVVEFPIARQLKCFQDGGFWWPADGSGVPNAGCREAFRRSGAYPFQQWNEITGFPQDYSSQASVEEAIKDGTLCSAGDPKKAGLDVRSTQWHKTPIKPQNGKIRMMYYATAAHNPSFVRIYLTKASYVYGDALRWSDLQLVYSGAAPAPQTIGGKRYYVYDVPIPAGRTGNAVLYTRWQRQDAGREGFYNCSDVTIETAAGVPTDGFPWFDGGFFIKQGFDPVPGDQVRFRVLGSDAGGKERVDERLAITAQNAPQSVWGPQLANLLNGKYSALLRIGERQGNDIVFNTANLQANVIWLKNEKDSAQLSILSPDAPTPAPSPAPSPAPTPAPAPAPTPAPAPAPAPSPSPSPTPTPTPTPAPAPAPAPGQYPKWPDGIGTYKPGVTVVIGVDGKLWRCRPAPFGGWCNINHPAYTPGGPQVPKEVDAQAWMPAQ